MLSDYLVMAIKHSTQTEYVLWGLPAGSSDRLDEKVLYTQGKTVEQIDAIKARAAQDGWHSFRVQTLDLSAAPDFSFIAK
jgi:hypothetical protein